MPISGLVVTLEGDENARVQAMERLSGDPRLTLGTPIGVCVPIVAETSTLAEGEALVDDLGRVDDIRFVDVVSVDFSDQDASPASGDSTKPIARTTTHSVAHAQDSTHLSQRFSRHGST